MFIYNIYNLRVDCNNGGSAVDRGPFAAAPSRGLLVDVLRILPVMSEACEDHHRLPELRQSKVRVHIYGRKNKHGNILTLVYGIF